MNNNTGGGGSIKNVIVNPSYLEIPTTPSPSYNRAGTRKRVPGTTFPRASSSSTRRKKAAVDGAAGAGDDISRRLEELRKHNYTEIIDHQGKQPGTTVRTIAKPGSEFIGRRYRFVLI